MAGPRRSARLAVSCTTRIWRGWGVRGLEPTVIILCIGYIQEQYSSAMRGKKALGLQGSKRIQLGLAEDIQTVQEDQSS